MKLPNDDMVQKLCFSADGKLLIGGSMGDGIGVWETARLTEKPVSQMKGLDEWIKGLGFSSDGRRCCGFDAEKRFVIWDAKSGQSNKTYEFDQFKREKRFMPRAGYVGPDGTLLLGTEDGELLHLTVKPAG
jgi:WD40 repeat protein